MCPYSDILVLLDCSPVDDAVLAEVLRIASCGKTGVTLVHVVHSHTLDQDRVLRQKTETYLEEKLQLFRDAAIPASTVFLSGEPEAELTRFINQGSFDLVALATHGHKMFKDILFGSVSDRLKHAVNVPLLMVRGNRKGQERK